MREARGVVEHAEPVEYSESSGNVFADLDLPDAEERLLKSQIALQIRLLVEQKGWTQTQVAERVGLDQPKVSALFRGRLAGFSLDRLFRILNRLGRSVEVRISAEEFAPEDTRMRVRVA